jgi:hypothetical protein
MFAAFINFYTKNNPIFFFMDFERDYRIGGTFTANFSRPSKFRDFLLINQSQILAAFEQKTHNFWHFLRFLVVCLRTCVWGGGVDRKKYSHG